ncbi:MAG: tRNA preQ1(34) S-adenosylmethionine ribosyltransferase-isomerase QueA [Hellea sp.]|nr:tRNA preQ1(34) S-adenosylmethionine ribosyltransferase-isomerase QueA [Hellea sp.]
MNLSDFDFYLPDEAIALRPAVPRDHARLLQIAGDGSLSDHRVDDLVKLLQPTDLLVLNETKVFPAALKATRPARAIGGGGDVSVHVNLHQQISDNKWKVFAKPAKRLRVGDGLDFPNNLSAEVFEKNDGGDFSLIFNQSGKQLTATFEAVGDPPLPPYISRQRDVDDQDREDYQTVFAQNTGSIAAPTAGLHFTPELIESLSCAGIETAKITLHVGAGTFLPVKTENLDDHKMHSEWYTISEETAARINLAKSEMRRVIAVGTTSLRALESASSGGRLIAKTENTDIFITPGYQFQIVDGLMTNFHLPKSTLFMLVSAMCGLDNIRKAYAHAIETGYRFYSYGDSSLMWKQS